MDQYTFDMGLIYAGLNDLLERVSVLEGKRNAAVPMEPPDPDIPIGGKVKRTTQRMQDEMKRLYRRRIPVREIAAALRVSSMTVYNQLRNAGELPPPKERMKKVILFLIAAVFIPLSLSAQSVLKGNATLTADAADAPGAAGEPVCGVAFVQFFIRDGVAIGPQIQPPLAGTSYVYLWDTKSIPNGTYSIVAKATDKAGLDGACDSSAPNTGTSAAQLITVNNIPPDVTPPTVTITVDLRLQGTVTITRPVARSEVRP